MLYTQENTMIRTLGDGLILRRSTLADAEKLFEFNAMIHGDDGPDERVGQWARDLLEKHIPALAWAISQSLKNRPAAGLSPH